MRWSSLMAWMSVVGCNVFYGNDASALNHKITIRLVTPSLCWKVIVDGSIKGWKNIFFSTMTTPPPFTQKLYIHSSAKFIYVVFFSRGMHQVWTCHFDGDVGDLKRPWYNFCTRAIHGNVAVGLYREIKSFGLEQCTLTVGHYGCPVTKPQIPHPSEV